MANRKEDGQLVGSESLTPTERAISAADIDLVEVARVTGGKVNFDADNEPHVVWRDRVSLASLEWEQVYDGIDPIEGKKTLRFWNGTWGGPGMEVCGLVLGKDFAAFVYPQVQLPEYEDIFAIQIISRGRITEIEAPGRVFSPVFGEAREIANRNEDAFRAAQK